MGYPMGGGKKNYKLTGKVGSKKDSKKSKKKQVMIYGNFWNYII